MEPIQAAQSPKEPTNAISAPTAPATDANQLPPQESKLIAIPSNKPHEESHKEEVPSKLEQATTTTEDSAKQLKVKEEIPNITATLEAKEGIKKPDNTENPSENKISNSDNKSECQNNIDSKNDTVSN
jgi:hypothetical protein